MMQYLHFVNLLFLRDGGVRLQFILKHRYSFMRTFQVFGYAQTLLHKNFDLPHETKDGKVDFFHIVDYLKCDRYITFVF